MADLYSIKFGQVSVEDDSVASESQDFGVNFSRCDDCCFRHSSNLRSQIVISRYVEDGGSKHSSGAMRKRSESKYLGHEFQFRKTHSLRRFASPSDKWGRVSARSQFVNELTELHSGQRGLYTLRRRHQIHDVCVIKPLANRRDWVRPDAQGFYFAPYSFGSCRILSNDSDVGGSRHRGRRQRCWCLSVRPDGNRNCTQTRELR